jgi:surface protein
VTSKAQRREEMNIRKIDITALVEKNKNEPTRLRRFIAITLIAVMISGTAAVGFAGIHYSDDNSEDVALPESTPGDTINDNEVDDDSSWVDVYVPQPDDQDTGGSENVTDDDGALAPEYPEIEIDTPDESDFGDFGFEEDDEYGEETEIDEPTEPNAPSSLLSTPLVGESNYVFEEGVLTITGGTLRSNFIDRPWSDYRDKITTINIEEEVIAEASLAYLFAGMANLTAINGIENINTSGVLDMHQMFSGTSGLTHLDLSAWDTSNVTNMSSMFAFTALTNLDLSFFNTKTVTDMSNMFRSADSLRKLTLGENFRFAGATAANLPEIMPTSGRTGNWINVGGGTVENPQGNLRRFTSTELMNGFNANYADTWVLESGIFVYDWERLREEINNGTSETIVILPRGFSGPHGSYDWHSNDGTMFNLVIQDTDHSNTNTITTRGADASATAIVVTRPVHILTHDNPITLYARQDISARHFIVAGSGSLTLGTGLTLDGNRNNINNNVVDGAAIPGGGVLVNGGTLILTGGAAIINSRAANDATSNDGEFAGGAVAIKNDGKLEMNSGRISGNYARSYGGGVFISGGTATMNGGAIESNHSGFLGGGVELRGSDNKLTLNAGASIRGNTAQTGGGGVNVGGSGSIVTINGADITGNSSYDVYGGGGLTIFDYGNKLIMNSGYITRNNAEVGGGIRVNMGAEAIMTGGEISGNTSTLSGGGVSIGAGIIGDDFLHSTFSMTGGVISDNTAGTIGGGIATHDYNSVSISPNAVFSGNRASASYRIEEIMPTYNYGDLRGSVTTPMVVGANDIPDTIVHRFAGVTSRSDSPAGQAPFTSIANNFDLNFTGGPFACSGPDLYFGVNHEITMTPMIITWHDWDNNLRLNRPGIAPSWDVQVSADSTSILGQMLVVYSRADVNDPNSVGVVHGSLTNAVNLLEGITGNSINLEWPDVISIAGGREIAVRTNPWLLMQNQNQATEGLRTYITWTTVPSVVG